MRLVIEIYKRLQAVIVSRWTIAIVCVIGTLALYELENQWFTMPFSISILLVLGALLFALTRRIALSIYAAWGLLGFVALVSLIKFKEQGFGLHAYDLTFAGGDSSLHTFLLENYAHLAVPVLIVLAVATIALILIGLSEQPRRTSLPLRLLAPAALLGLLPLTIPEEALSDRHEYLVGGHHASSFFVSFLDIAAMNRRHELANRLATLPAPPAMENAVACPADNDRPDVFIVLSETQAPPAIFPDLEGKSHFAEDFLSQDGSSNLLGVETYGGGTWISTLSLMTGLSAADFGWQRPYLTITLMNKIKGALPDVMAQCGYRSAAILPMDYNFVNEGAFLSSIGFETVLDADDIGAADGHMRDSFYYEAAEKFIADHRENDGRPLFLMVQTMFPHGPHNSRMEPDIKPSGEPFNGVSEINEYLRRLKIARGDFDAFLGTLETGSTERGTVVLEFGDHQGVITRSFVEQVEGPGILGDWDSLAYTTHFTTHAYGRTLQPMEAEFDRLDIGFLGTTFARMAGLPSSPMMDDLAKLRDRCAGRFHTCPDRDLVDRHLRQRIDAGLLDLSGDSPAS